MRNHNDRISGDVHGRYLTEWNPLREWRYGETRLQGIVEEECKQINRMPLVAFFEYVKTVTDSKIVPIAAFFWQSRYLYDSYKINPEALVNTVQSILDCIRCRLQVHWNCLKNQKNEACTTLKTLEEIMSKDIPTEKHTVFHLLHSHMKTINRIDHPITVDKPGYLRKILLEIQEHHQLIVRYITDFNEQITLCKNPRVHAILTREANRIRATRRREAQRHEAQRRQAQRRQAQRRQAQRREAQRREAQRHEAQRRVAERRDAADQLVRQPVHDAVSPPAPKRRRTAPNRLNIASTKGKSYQ